MIGELDGRRSRRAASATFLKPLQLLHRSRHRADADRGCTAARLRCPRASPVFVTSHAHASSIRRARSSSSASRTFVERERRVAQAKAERIQRRHVVEQIAAPRRRLVVVERRQMCPTERGMVIGSLPPGLKSPNSTSATACAASPGRDTSTRESPAPSRSDRVIDSGRPLNSSATTGLPVASIASTSSFCRPIRSRLVRSPMCLQRSTLRATSARCRRSPARSRRPASRPRPPRRSAGGPRRDRSAMTSSCVPRAADRDLAAFGCRRPSRGRRRASRMPSSTVTSCFGTPL